MEQLNAERNWLPIPGLEKHAGKFPTNTNRRTEGKTMREKYEISDPRKQILIEQESPQEEILKII